MPEPTEDLYDPEILRFWLDLGINPVSLNATTTALDLGRMWAQVDAWEEAELFEKITAEFTATDLRLDGDPESLQNRLIRFADSRNRLKPLACEQYLQAEESRRVLAGSLRRMLSLDVHGRSKKLMKWAKAFTVTELFYIAALRRIAPPNFAFLDRRLRRILDTKMVLGRGREAMQLLLRVFSSTIGPVKEKWKTPVKSLLIACEMWTCPACPMWMLSGEPGARLLNSRGAAVPTRTAFNTLAGENGLVRLKLDSIDELLVKAAPTCPDARRLLRELETGAAIPNFSFESIRPGRRKSGGKHIF